MSGLLDGGEQAAVKVLVTGGAGFIGSNLCERLHKDGHEVVCLDNLSSGRMENVGHLRASKRFRLVRADVDAMNLDDQFPVDQVYYLAGHASPKDYATRPMETLLTSVYGLDEVLQVCALDRTPMVWASTSEVYGNPSVVPTPETYIGAINPLGWRSSYDVGKLFGDTLCYLHWKTNGTPVKMARLFNAYGPKMGTGDGRVVSEFIVRALEGKPMTINSGKQTRSFSYVDDTVEGLIRLMDKGRPGTPYNIGNPVETTIRELAETILRLTQREGGVEVLPSNLPDDPDRRCPDITKARTELGWEPKVNLEEGLMRTIEWFRSRKW